MAEHHSPEERERIVAAITAVVAHDFRRASAEFQEMIVAEIVMAASDARSPLHRAFVEWDDSRVAGLHRELNAYRRRNTIKSGTRRPRTQSEKQENLDFISM